MFEKLASIEKKYEDLIAQLGDPGVLSDPGRYAKMAKQQRELEEVVTKYRTHKALTNAMQQAQQLLNESDPEMAALASEEYDALQKKISQCEEELKVLLLPKDPNDEKNVLLEVRAGTGGDEAALFAAETFRMYSRFAERQGWKIDVVSMTRAGQGGIKEVIARSEERRVGKECRSRWSP